MKKAIIYLCYIIVSITIFGHSIVPHIYHDGHLCLLTENVLDGHTSCESEEGHRSCHQHDGKNETTEDCLLTKFVFRPDSDNGNYKELSCITNLLPYYANLPADILLNPTFTLLDKQRTHCFIHYKSTFSGHNKSLRAPPTA